MPKNLLFSFILLGLLSACAEERRLLQPPPRIPQPSPSAAAPEEEREMNPEVDPPTARWHSLATLEVEGHPDRTAVIDVLVQNKGGTCGLVRRHARIATDKK